MKKGTFRVSASSSAEDLADWLEWRALHDRDGSVSIVDLQRELTRTGSTDALAPESAPAGVDDRGSEIAETIAAGAFSRLKERVSQCGDTGRYPFAVNGLCLERAEDADESLYTFLLLLSTYGPKKRAKGDVPAGTFEDVARHAAEGYCGGPSAEVGSFAFGFPRRAEPAGFRDAIDSLCRVTGEGDGHHLRPVAADQKDAKLDLVVWRSFADRRRGKWWAFGQCAAGMDWREKVSELDSEAFCELWLKGDVPVKPSRMFFVPHAVEDHRWIEVSRRAGIVFDRCRIVAVAKTIPRKTEKAYRKWSRTILKREVRA